MGRVWLLCGGVVLACVALLGCATNLLSRQESVLVQTTPAGASVFLNGEFRGLTPLDVVVSPHTTYTLTLTKDGYASYETTWRPRVELRPWGPLTYDVNTHPPVSVSLLAHATKENR